MEWLFSYGTLQKEKVQLELFGRILNSSRDSLKGFRITSIENKTGEAIAKYGQQYNLIVVRSANEKDVVEGTALEVTNDELLMADAYEPKEYKRVKLELSSGKKAWIYMATGD